MAKRIVKPAHVVPSPIELLDLLIAKGYFIAQGTAYGTGNAGYTALHAAAYKLSTGKAMARARDGEAVVRTMVDAGLMTARACVHRNRFHQWNGMAYTLTAAGEARVQPVRDAARPRIEADRAAQQAFVRAELAKRETV